MERFLDYMTTGLRSRGYQVRIFHREGCVPPRWRSPRSKLGRLVAGLMYGYFIGREAKRALHPRVRLVLSNSTVGWYPLGHGVKQAHFHHGTYRGQAESVRPLIPYRGYLTAKWYLSMGLERRSGAGKLCLCNSDQTRDEVRRFFGQDAQTVWLPVDTKHFRPQDKKASRRALGLPEAVPVVLYVGSANPNKGLGTVVRKLMASLREVHWCLVIRGQAPVGPQTRNVTVFQDAGYQQLPRIYNAADVSVCPSRYEAFGYVVVEALACGTPVVATPGGASRIFLTDPNVHGLLVDPDDVGGFEDAIRGVLADLDGYRHRVIEVLRRQLELRLAPENWWPRFLDVTGLDRDGGRSEAYEEPVARRV